MTRRILFIGVALLLSCAPVFSYADTATSSAAEALRKQIEEHNAHIDALNKEIAQYEQQLTVVSSKKKTLQTTLSQLDLTRKKVTSSINVTKNKIGATELQISQLQRTIAATQDSIDADKNGIAEAVRAIRESDAISLASVVFSTDNLSELWQDTDRLGQFSNAISDRITDLNAQKRSLAENQAATESKRSELLNENKTLTAQQGSLDAVRRSQSELLTQTKSQESAYQALIAQKKAQEAAFEDALTDLKGKLAQAVNAADITKGGKGILQWPVDTVRITQYFGNTAFAASGAYSGKGHNGIDLAASIGTPLKAARSGIVIGTGNTDSVKGCYSFGKWVLIKHDNGLDTLYAHLSQIKVYAGQSVDTGELIGYSGETGYATGPHLHFGVYVTSATQIIRLGDATNSKTPCSSAIMPVAPLSAYLNPMNYL